MKERQTESDALPEFIMSGNNTIKGPLFDNVSNIEMDGTGPFRKPIMGSLGSSTNELSLKRFIDKNKELLMP